LTETSVTCLSTIFVDRGRWDRRGGKKKEKNLTEKKKKKKNHWIRSLLAGFDLYIVYRRKYRTPKRGGRSKKKKMEKKKKKKEKGEEGNAGCGGVMSC